METNNNTVDEKKLRYLSHSICTASAQNEENCRSKLTKIGLNVEMWSSTITLSSNNDFVVICCISKQPTDKIIEQIQNGVSNQILQIGDKTVTTAIYQEFWKQSFEFVWHLKLDQLIENTEKKLIICGHSVGGAIALCLALRIISSQLPLKTDIKKLLKNIYVITFGSPLIGDCKLESLFEEISMTRNFFQYVNKKDPIPLFPKCFDAFLIKLNQMEDIKLEYGLIGTLGLIVGDADNQTTNLFSEAVDKLKWISICEKDYQFMFEIEDDVNDPKEKVDPLLLIRETLVHYLKPNLLESYIPGAYIESRNLSENLKYGAFKLYKNISQFSFNKINKLISPPTKVTIWAKERTTWLMERLKEDNNNDLSLLEKSQSNLNLELAKGRFAQISWWNPYFSSIEGKIKLQISDSVTQWSFCSSGDSFSPIFEDCVSQYFTYFEPKIREISKHQIDLENMEVLDLGLDLELLLKEPPSTQPNFDNQTNITQQQNVENKN